ncbi:MAG: M20/M25/M40 family metallo-hydrolase [Gemmatimonadota bacterium]|nr:M20/M25/M40 family metallo-hydrolase [Gemmatimonadota bacterium]
MSRTRMREQHALEARSRSLLDSRELAPTRAFIVADDARTLRQQCELTQIPAPPFREGPRADRMAQLMADSGLDGAEKDGAGNVLGWWGASRAAPVVVSAHLDTVFPEGTDVHVRKRGGRLVGPGISDDARGLAALLGLARALSATGLELERPVLFAATTGEEGEGDLRGARHLFREGGPAREASAFLSLDGAGLGRVVTRGLGSRRFRLRVRGPGGHSWVDWGTPNPIHALGRAVTSMTELRLCERPRSTLTVGRWSGGTSVNSIPQDAWVEVEIRSESRPELDRLEAEVRTRADEALHAVDRGAATGRRDLKLTVEVIGDRPVGRTDSDALLVRAAVAATRAVGAAPQLDVSSTDANIPMSLGIPAVTMGAGGVAGLAHTTEEWYRNERGPEGLLRALLTLMMVAKAN